MPEGGFQPSQIVYSGSNLNSIEMEQVLHWGIPTLNLDSLAQLALCCDVYGEMRAQQPAGNRQDEETRGQVGLPITHLPSPIPRLGLRLNLPELTGDSRIGVRSEEFPAAIALK